MPQASGEITANLVDVENRSIHYTRVVWQDGIISEVEPLGSEHSKAPYHTPGLIDAHVHIESSMLPPPAEFGRQAVRHGTVATVSDPHEIANVLGVEAVHYMLDSAAASPCKIFFGIPFATFFLSIFPQIRSTGTNQPDGERKVCACL